MSRREKEDKMTKGKFEELKTALESVGFALMRIEENTETLLWADGEPSASYGYDQPDPRLQVKSRIYLEALSLPLPADFLQQ
jgi:hypothetical protein